MQRVIVRNSIITEVYGVRDYYCCTEEKIYKYAYAYKLL